MAYISGGQVSDQRPLLRASLLSDLFWGLMNFIMMFFGTLFSPDKYQGFGNSEYRQMARGNGNRNMFGNDPARRRRGGFKRNNGPAPPPMGGG
eukprot:m.57615 g.57615  ORF g.57615 m.57615 type:complete len:93 (-) comp11241_c0_seq1:582-860(-)